METLQPTYIVGLGGSAGSMVPFIVFLESLSTITGMAFIFVSHLLPTCPSQLCNILQLHSKMPVSVIFNGLPILANNIYVIPQNTQITVENFIFKVTTIHERTTKTIDVLFISLARTMGPNAVGIIFSGYCNDGSDGCKQIKDKGGLTFAQDLSAEIPDMPLNAQASGCIDFVLPPEAIAAEIERQIKNRLESGNRQILAKV
jgi:two-component system CheB/CheR fusion protein